MQKEHIVVADIVIEVWRKPIKSINLVISGPDGRVRISVPHITSDARVRQVVMDRMGWIRQQQEHFRARPAVIMLQAASGEMHSLWGKFYQLNVVEKSFRHHVRFDPVQGISLHVRSGTSADSRLRLLAEWYRGEMKRRIPGLLAIWQPRVGRKVSEFRIKRMKTRWGTCNITSRRLWLNLELAKKPEECLEYILVHELVHLLERGHNKKFYAHMDRLLPQWRNIDRLLREM
ncbi:MAG: SprT family zinc-dependent metalloprotease [Thermodesulfobacteriota bacterium]|nr:SprT family zinc-dependent metalloprotease [Thermodesulfobacteriota bacterium]